MTIKNLFKKIDLIGFDVDGVFTDGRIRINEDGVESKVFHTHDGQGIRQLIKAGKKILIISGRESNAAAKRMKELGITDVFLGCKNKEAIFVEKSKDYEIPLSRCAFMGDDIADKSILEIVGLPITVANAHKEVKNISAYITKKTGGEGAIREITDLLIT